MTQRDGSPELSPDDVQALQQMAQWWRENRPDKSSGLTRRKVLGLLGGSAVGAAGMGAFAGSAAAGTDSVGQIGTASEPSDAYLEDVYDAGGNNPMSFPGDGSVNIDSRTLGPNNEIKFAASDNELDTAISNASQSDVIYLGRGTFSSARTISTRGLSFIGLGVGDGGTDLTGDWDLAGGENTVQSVRISGGSITISGVALSTVGRCSAGPITVDGGGDERALITGCAGVDVTFASGSSNNVVDGCTNSTATDNSGNNTIGIIN